MRGTRTEAWPASLVGSPCVQARYGLCRIDQFSHGLSATRRDGQLAVISHDTSPLSSFGLRVNAARRGVGPPHGLSEVESSVEFCLGPGRTAAQSMRRARGFVAKVLPALLAGAPGAQGVEETALAVLTELVDVAARHRASVDLSGRVSCDRDHVLITVGEMGRPLPAPEGPSPLGKRPTSDAAFLGSGHSAPTDVGEIRRRRAVPEGRRPVPRILASRSDGRQLVVTSSSSSCSNRLLSPRKLFTEASSLR